MREFEAATPQNNNCEQNVLLTNRCRQTGLTMRNDACLGSNALKRGQIKSRGGF